MPFVWKEYLFIAQHLQAYTSTNFSQEAAFRCAVSRSYYAAFCHARNYARDHQGFIPSNTANDHYHVRAHFKKRDVTVASALDQLRQWRNQCDYDDTVAGLTHLLRSAMAEAQKIFNRL
jgi:hypothetical protein